MINGKIVLGFSIMVACTIAANLMLKLGASATPAERILLGVLGWKSVAGLALFGCAGLLYAFLLRSVPLNFAQVLAASQFIGVIIAGCLILGEPISPGRWIGISCIGLGILLATSYS